MHIELQRGSLFFIALFLLLLFLLGGCNFYDSHGRKLASPTNAKSPTPGGAVTTYAWLKDEVFKQRCLNCHTGPTARKHLDLSSYGATTASKQIVLPGNADESKLFQRVRDDEMPPDEPLPQSEKDWIQKWIQEGANP
jgi:uncharacterized membrane protein